MAGNSATAKKIHPFFSAPKNPSKDTAATALQAVTPEPSCSPNSDKAYEPAEADEGDDVGPGSRRKRRKTEPAPEVKHPIGKREHRGKRQKRVSGGASITRCFGQKDSSAVSELDESDMQRGTGEVEVDDITEQQEEPSLPLPQAGQSTLNTDSTSAWDWNNQKSDSYVKPQKLLKLNTKTGTIGSPPNPRLQTNLPDVATTKPRGRPRRNKATNETTRIVCIFYGTDNESRTRIGKKIEEIFSRVRLTPMKKIPGRSVKNGTAKEKARPSSSDSDKSFSGGSQTPKTSIPKKTGSPRKAVPKKVTHPFFTGKAKEPTVLPPTNVKDNLKSPVKRLTIFTSTPCSPKHIRPPPLKVNLPQFGRKTGGVKVHGAQHPAWPAQGMVHVHGDERDNKSRQSDSLYAMSTMGRKLKGQQSYVAPEESMMCRAVSGLELDCLAEELKSLSTEDFQPPPPELRIPERCFESGKRLQLRIDPELRTCRSDLKATTHPVVTHAYNSLTKSLSAFDRSKCENLSWAHKYAPASSDCILQSGREAELLRDWLLTLKVQSVHTGASDNKSKPTLLKKRRKRKKLNGFVVSSDEEDNEMGEISEVETDWMPIGSQGSARRTVIRAGDTARGTEDNTRLTNAVVLSGPHGCGKTATVYAIAKELDFEVFEINPGSRRNGKDVMEKIGDMTRNHLVQHRHNESESANTEGTEVVSEDEVERDIKSGKQGMMTAFFKPKATALAPPKQTKPDTPEIKQPLPEKVAKKLTGTTQQKQQKQSLILLEEVDILYEEDKQFWATVISLMAQSKRPFIMTCNDENLVPLQSLCLHGIFRFSTPPREPAIDLLLLIAASEGHALRREAVETLFDSRSQDLRASITELNYWCQIGVGDPKGGFGWFCRRWPIGIDVDEQGDKIRVISVNTYQKGMGWLGRDAALVPSAYRSTEEEIAQQIWENWNLDASDFQDSVDWTSWAYDASSPEATHSERLAALEIAETFAELASAADICSAGALSLLNEVILDPTQPDLPSKSKDDFIIGRKLLDATPLTDYNNGSFQITSTMRSLGRECLAEVTSAYDADIRPLDHASATCEVHKSFSQPTYRTMGVTRHYYSIAFDPIAVLDGPSQPSGYVDPSVFDRTMSLITLDVAPYVRSIVAYDQQLQQERLMKSNLLSEGGKPKKRIRTTRSAYSALEGGSRASTRRERYFTADISPHLVTQTGGKGWGSLLADNMNAIRSGKASSANTTQSNDEDADATMDD